MDLVSASPIYAIVAIGFMVPAEKLLRKFFGFDSAGTLSAAGSFAGGAVFSAMINKLNRPKPGKGGSGGGNDEKEGKRPTRMANSGGGGVDADATLYGGSRDNKSSSSNGSRATSGSTQSGASGRSTTSGNPQSGTSGRSTTPENVRTESTGDVQLGTSSENVSGGISSNTSKSSSSIRSRFKNEKDLPEWMQSNKVTRWDRLRNSDGLADAARALGYGYKDRVIKGAKTIPRRLRRGAIGGVVGGSLAIAGAAVGIASGSPSDAFKYATAGGAAGYYGANYYGDKLAKEAGVASKMASPAFWGKQAKQRQQYLFDKEFKKNPENINTLTKALGSRDKAKEAMKDGSVQALLNNGITDPSKVAKALKLRDRYYEKRNKRKKS